jgi:DNA-binding protein HU-beta
MPPAKKSPDRIRQERGYLGEGRHSEEAVAIAEKSAPIAKATAVPAKKVAAPVKAALTKTGGPVAKTVAPATKKAAPTAKKAAVKAAPQITVTLKQIAAELAENHDLPRKVAEAVLGDLVTLATQHLKNGDKIRLTGLGILQVRAKEARMGRNPKTGEPIQIAASKKVAFKPSKELKESV